MSEANIWQPRTVIDVLKLVPITDAAGSRSITYPADLYAAISMVNAAGATITINLDATAPFLDGEHFTVANDTGTGTVTFVAVAGVTLIPSATGLSIGPGQAATFVHMGANYWRMFSGDSVTISADFTATNAAIATNTADIVTNSSSITALQAEIDAAEATITALTAVVNSYDPGLVTVVGDRSLDANDVRQTLDVTVNSTLTLPSNLGDKNGNMIQMLTGPTATAIITPSGVTLGWVEGTTITFGARTVAPNSAVTLVRKTSAYWTLFGNGIS